MAPVYIFGLSRRPRIFLGHAIALTLATSLAAISVSLPPSLDPLAFFCGGMAVLVTYLAVKTELAFHQRLQRVKKAKHDIAAWGRG